VKNTVFIVGVGLGIAVIVYLIYAILLYFDIRGHSWPRVPITQATSFPPGYAFFAALLSVPISFPIGVILACFWVAFRQHARFRASVPSAKRMKVH
jgi:hypothetical protein